MTSRFLLAAVLGVAACDSGSPGVEPPPAESRAIQVTPPPTLSGRSGSTDTLRLDLATVFRGPSGERLAFALDGAAPYDVTLLGSTLRIAPRSPDTVRVTVKASSPSGSVAQATITAAFGYTGRITVLAPLQPVTLRARGDTLVVDLVPRVSAPAGATFALERPMAGVSLDGARLVLAPQQAMTATVAVRVSAVGYDGARLTMALTGRSDWCATSPPGTVDPFPYQVGDEVRFWYRYDYAASIDGTKLFTQSGPLQWRVLARSACEFGSTVLTIRQHQALADTVTNRDGTLHYGKEAVEETRDLRVVLLPTGQIDATSFTDFTKFGVDVPPIARWFPSTGTFATNREWGYIRGYFRTRYDADAQGLKSWQYRDKPDQHSLDRGAVVTRLGR